MQRKSSNKRHTFKINYIKKYIDINTQKHIIYTVKKNNKPNS